MEDENLNDYVFNEYVFRKGKPYINLSVKNPYIIVDSEVFSTKSLPYILSSNHNNKKQRIVLCGVVESENGRILEGKVAIDPEFFGHHCKKLSNAESRENYFRELKRKRENTKNF